MPALRDEVIGRPLFQARKADMFKGKTCLITGGTGTFGNAGTGTVINVTRYGNVMARRGSVIHSFSSRSRTARTS